MRLIYRLLFLIGLQLISGSLQAHSDRYDCEVKQFAWLDYAGKLRDAGSESLMAALSKRLVENTFSVGRLTGRIYGNSWFNTSYFEKVTIISNGRENNDFRVVSVGRPQRAQPHFFTLGHY